MTNPLFSPTLLQLEVINWEQMVAFYRDTLGFRPMVLEPEHRYGWLDAGTITLAIRGITSKAEGVTAKLSMQIEVNNLEDAIELLEERGCQFTSKQFETGEAYQVAHFHDPEGNPLAIYSISRRH